MSTENSTSHAWQVNGAPSADTRIGFFTDKAVSKYAWGITLMIFGGLVLLVSFFIYSAGTAGDRRIIFYFVPPAVALIVAGFFIRKFTSARRYEGFTLSGFLIGKQEIQYGECTLVRANPNAEEGYGFRIHTWKSLSKEMLDRASPAELMIRIMPMETKDSWAFDIAEIQITKGNLPLKSLWKGDGIRLWLMEDDRFRRIRLSDALYLIPDLFPRLTAIADAVAPLHNRNVKVKLQITVPREHVGMALVVLGPLAALAAACLQSKESREVREFIQKGRLIDKQSGEDILSFSERMGWEFAID